MKTITDLQKTPEKNMMLEDGYLMALKDILKLIEEEKRIVKTVCQGMVHPSQENVKEFREWLQGTVIFHLDQLEGKIK